MRRIVLSAAVAAVALFATLAIVAVVVIDRMDFDQYRALVAQRAAAALGRPVAITGKLEIRAGWSPWLSLEGLEIGNAPGAGRPTMIEAGRVEASLQLLPLLFSGRLSLTTFNLIDAKIWLEIDEHGRGNWELDGGGGRPPLVYAAEARRVLFLLDDRRDHSHREFRIRRGAAHAESLTGTVKLSADGRMDDDRYELRGNFGPLSGLLEDGNLVRVDLEATLAGLRLGAKGTVLEPRKQRGISLGLSAGGEDAQLLGRWIGRPLPKLGGFRAAARLDDRTGRLALRDIDVVLGGRETQQLAVKGEVSDLLADGRSRGMALELALEGGDAAATARTLGFALPAIGAFGGKARLTDAGGKLALDEIGLAAGDREMVAFLLRGRIGDLLAANGPGELALDLTVEARSSGALAPVLGVALPDAGSFVLTAKLGGTPRSLALERLAAKLGTSDLYGDGTVTLGGARPRLVLNLSSTFLNLDELLPKSPPSPPARDGRLIPPTPIHLEWLRSIDLALKLDAGQVKGLGLEAATLRLDAGLEAAILALRQSRFGLGAGSATLDATIDASAAPPQVKLKAGGRGFDIRQLARPFGGAEGLDGKLDFNIDVTTRGDNLRALAAGLDGQAALTLTDGRLAHRNIDWLAADLTRMVLPGSAGEPDTQISCGVLRTDLRRGLATVQSLVLDTRRVTVTGSGTANLGTEALALRLDPKPKEASLISLAHPVLIGGSFASPTLRPDPLGVAKGVGGLALGLATGPIGLLVPFLSKGSGETHPCAKLFTGSK